MKDFRNLDGKFDSCKIKGLVPLSGIFLESEIPEADCAPLCFQKKDCSSYAFRPGSCRLLLSRHSFSEKENKNNKDVAVNFGCIKKKISCVPEALNNTLNSLLSQSL